MAHALQHSQLLKLVVGDRHYPKPVDFTPSYGTAGFRSLAERLPSTVYRCGLLMAARSMAVGAATGLVVTASHNPAQDNGVKLVEPSGYMLQQSWEVHANKLAQCADGTSLQSCLQELFTSEGIPTGEANALQFDLNRPFAPENHRRNVAESR